MKHLQHTETRPVAYNKAPRCAVPQHNISSDYGAVTRALVTGLAATLPATPPTTPPTPPDHDMKHSVEMSHMSHT